jgi:hypothetical protein
MLLWHVVWSSSVWRETSGTSVGVASPYPVRGRAYGMTTCRTCKEGEVDHGGKGSGAGVDLPVFRVWLVRLSTKAKILTVSGVVPLLEPSTRQPSPVS